MGPPIGLGTMGLQLSGEWISGSKKYSKPSRTYIAKVELATMERKTETFMAVENWNVNLKKSYRLVT